ncbi:MAG TPA: DUF2630 family protein [Acidimicrobiales bacterium]|nr:DUF2630 family protein [Acidimicrobiales bacterium]
MSTDEDVIARIDTLVEEEHRLHERTGVGEALSQADQDRLRALEVQLDQCWDLLRQRRARRGAGQDPEAAAARSAEVVEHYEQ